jgi:hypothetical protein
MYHYDADADISDDGLGLRRFRDQTHDFPENLLFDRKAGISCLKSGELGYSQIEHISRSKFITSKELLPRMRWTIPVTGRVTWARSPRFKSERKLQFMFRALSRWALCQLSVTVLSNTLDGWCRSQIGYK